MPIEFEELELPFAELGHLPEGSVAEAGDGPTSGAAPAPVCVVNRDPLGTFPCCPLCGGELRPEHAHFRCACGWRDSCCD
ncbi:MAG: hypothetical protein ACO1PW_03685 [Actinomycetota bacterium]